MSESEIILAVGVLAMLHAGFTARDIFGRLGANLVATCFALALISLATWAA